jgi:hypothetical protein
MKIDLERKLIEKFVTKNKRERFLTFIEKEKTRKKFLKELYHFKDFDWKLFREIPGSQNEREVVTKKVGNRKTISSCYVISANKEFDERTFSVSEAILEVVGQEGTILIFGEAEVVYYEAEAFDGRYISL